jgi:hypothetical protein
MNRHPDALTIVAQDEGSRRVYRANGAVWDPATPLPLDEKAGKHPVFVVIHPTKTYSEGMGGGGAEMAPEDRAAVRAIRRQAVSVVCAKVGTAAANAAGDAGPSSLVELDLSYLRRAPALFRECMTTPNRQDYTWLLTKTFGFNLLVRLFFTGKAVMSGDLPLTRAVLSTSWYQLQDSVFTVFGQTYMKFLGRMTGMVRVARVYLGDFVFVYVQLCGFEFLNRLVLGPLGENPLVYTWKGIGLIFINILQGMVSGGPLIPAINKMRRAGVISHGAMMHLYQISSLTMQFGLFAAFGYQKFYALLTGGTLLLSWGSYAVFTVGFQDPPFETVSADEAASAAAAR